MKIFDKYFAEKVMIWCDEGYELVGSVQEHNVHDRRMCPVQSHHSGKIQMLNENGDDEKSVIF